MEKKRIFAAIDISDHARERVAAYIKSIRSEFQHIPVRWENPGKRHITIKFVGNVNVAQLEEFTARVADAAKHTSLFSITVTETGAFMKRSSRANVLWLGSRSDSSSSTAELMGNSPPKDRS